MQMLVDREVARSGQAQPGLTGRLRGALREIDRRYDPKEEVDLIGKSGALVAYGLYVAALAAGPRVRGKHPTRYHMSDLLLGGIATHKFARLVTKSSVASPLRAPFTEFEECSGPSEHNERPRHDGHVRHAVGELLTCPFCFGVWVGTGYVAALALAPRGARAWAAVFTVTAVADTMQHAYDALKGRAGLVPRPPAFALRASFRACDGKAAERRQTGRLSSDANAASVRPGRRAAGEGWWPGY